MQGEKKISRSLLSRKYSLSYDLKGEVTEAQLRSFTEQLVTAVLLPLRGKTGILEDLKGRDSVTLPGHQSGAPFQELLFLSGHIEVQPDEVADDEEVSEELREILAAPTPPAPTIEAWSLSLRTAFLRFKRFSHIEHQVNEERFGPLPPESLELLVKNPALRIEHLRLGLDFFRSSLISSMLGIFPVLHRYFWLEITKGQLQLRLQADELKNETGAVLEEQQILSQLASLFENIFSHSLRKDLHA